MPWNGKKLASQVVTLTSGYWESGNAGSYNLQSGVIVVMKELNFVEYVDSIYLQSGPTGFNYTVQQLSPVGIGGGMSGTQYASGANNTNIVQFQIYGHSGVLVSGAATVSGVQVIVTSLGF